MEPKENDDDEHDQHQIYEYQKNGDQGQGIPQQGHVEYGYSMKDCNAVSQMSERDTVLTSKLSGHSQQAGEQLKVKIDGDESKYQLKDHGSRRLGCVAKTCHQPGDQFIKDQNSAKYIQLTVGRCMACQNRQTAQDNAIADPGWQKIDGSQVQIRMDQNISPGQLFNHEGEIIELLPG